MAEAATTAPPQEVAPAQDTGQSQGATSQQQGTPQGSFLDPDVIVVLFLAIIIDILDVVLAIGVIVNLILGGFLILWMVWKSGRIEAAREQIERVRQAPKVRQDFRQSQQASIAARKKATGRALKRGLLFFLGGLIPILSIFVVWTWAVISTVRGK
ncbi:MAG: hypothetical protein Q7S62_00960 [bacterium]|nr:hypothetical protein [bacterium]